MRSAAACGCSSRGPCATRAAAARWSRCATTSSTPGTSSVAVVRTNMRALIERAMQLLAELGLAGDAHREVRELPCGKQPKIEIAPALPREGCRPDRQRGVGADDSDVGGDAGGRASAGSPAHLGWAGGGVRGAGRFGIQSASDSGAGSPKLALAAGAAVTSPYQRQVLRPARLASYKATSAAL